MQKEFYENLPSFIFPNKELIKIEDNKTSILIFKQKYTKKRKRKLNFFD